MTFFTVAALAICAAGSGSTLSGQVLTLEGKPVPQARVFVEQGLAGPVRESRADNDGMYRFENVDAGTVGVFAIAGAYAFGGLSITVPSDERIGDLTIRLRPRTSLSGTIQNEEGDPVSGARIIRVGLMNEPQAKNPNATTKLGIPYTKLEPVGFEPVVSDAKGHFTLSTLPEDGMFALKIACQGYAQQGVTDIPAGDASVKIVLKRGVLINGRVLTRSSKEPLSGASVVLRNAQPPHDTSVTRSDGAGQFALRLEPGVYLYQVTGGDFRGVGWQELLVTGEYSAQDLVVYAAAACEIRGKVANAVTGDPVPGARIVLRAFGNPDSSARTNALGQYVLQGVEGENTVILESAPGYILPERNARPVQAAENEHVELPAFWVLPTPDVRMTIVDQELEPAPRCVVSLVQPPQFGWQSADDAGLVPLRVGQLASEGVIMGIVEHLTSNHAALFAFNARDTKEPVVQLLPVSTVTGQTRCASGPPVPGVILSVVLADDQMESPIWRTVTGPDGRFEIPSVVPHVQLQCIAQSPGGNVKSPPFLLAPAATKDIGEITVPESAAGVSLLQQPLKWRDYARIAGPEVSGLEKGPAVLAFCQHEQVSMTIEGWEHASSLLAEPTISVVVVADAPIAAPIESQIPVLQASKPGAATTYLISSEGKVVRETFGMPPVSMLRQLRSGSQ
ncbi:MAG TPA: carboxypeptidase-like regulatory domain-containing protein [Candidatus Hydrogenedentes bacterium]|nr:carboxypeptidase-like regulatory domain-containing protein [Candidatus Hydrogenedentota bacterium]HQM49168.1 carboxypeptidase-like regulatory domain-containing protein [Candidatus Hydrogenedentota bacterium]